MLFQCAAVVASLLILWMGSDRPDWLPMALSVLAWLAVLSTIQSGLDYVFAAVRFFRQEG